MVMKRAEEGNGKMLSRLAKAKKNWHPGCRSFFRRLAWDTGLAVAIL